MSSTKKKSIVILGVALICLVLLASSVIIAEHSHVCIGAKCALCGVIDAVQKLLAGLLVITVASILLTPVLFDAKYLSFLLKKSFFSTLVKLKVKLSD